MADNVKDLVVRLSFEHGDTKSQIAAIKNEIKLLDTGFQAAASAAGGFSGGLNAAAAQADTLRRQITLQEQAISKYGSAIEESQNKVAAAQKRQKDYAKALEEAKGKHKDLVSEKKKLTAAMEKEKATNGETSEAYAEMQAHMEELNQALADNEKAIRDAERGYERADKSIANADKQVQRLTISQNEAKIKLAEMNKKLDEGGNSAKKYSEKLKAASTNLKAYSTAAVNAGQAQEKLGKTLNKGTTAIVAAGVASVGATVSWESSFAGVRKTVNGTEAELKKIEQGLLDMGEAIPSEYSALAEIAENAGQLGIATENVLDFTRTMANMAETTNLTSDAASSGFAQYTNITQMAQKDISRLASVTVELGNNLATTESDILNFATNIAAAGSQAGLTDAQIFGLAGGLASLGLEAAAGGTAFSKALSGMQVAVETGSEDLQAYADVAGMTAESFAKAFREDAAGAFVSFVQGLSSGSESAIVMLDEMGITETRMRDTLLRASNASDLLTKSLDMANSAWDENTALTNEANVRYGTTASKMTILGNRVQRTAIQFGEGLLPALESGMNFVDNLVDKFAALDDNQRKQILTWGAYAAAVGPAVSLIGKGNTALATAAGKLGDLASKLADTDKPMTALIGSVGKLLGPVGVAALAAGAGYAAYKFVEWASGAKAAREALEDMADVAQKMKETQAETLYDKGSGNALARFGLSEEDFATTAAQDWLTELKKVWSDGEKESNALVEHYAESFKDSSDKVREKIQSRGSLLEGLGTLDNDTQNKMDEDLKQLDAWDTEIANLLKKRQNKLFTEEDQQRLDEVVKLRAELELEYGGFDKSGYDKILEGMDAEIARMYARGQSDNADPTLYGDVLNGLAEGRKAYNETLDASYDKQYAEIQLIQDQAERTKALEALNKQYNEQREAGEKAYQDSVLKAASQAWEATNAEEQENKLYELAQLLGDVKEIDPVAIDKWVTDNIDEGAMTSMIALAEQLAATGDEDSIARLDGIRRVIEGIVNIADENNLSGLSEIFGEAIPEEVLRIVGELDMEGATETWNTWKSDKETLNTSGTMDVKLNPLDQATIDAWEAENSSISLTGPKAKVGVALGATWKSELKTKMDAGILKIYGPDGKKIDVTANPQVLDQLDANDIIAVDEDGTYHVMVTFDVGSTEAVEYALEELGESNYSNDPKVFSPTPLISSAQEDIDRIREISAAIDEYQKQLDKLDEGEQLDEAFEQFSRTDLTSGIQGMENILGRVLGDDLTEDDINAMALAASQLTAALSSGDLDSETAAQYKAQLQQILDIISLADEYLGTGNAISEGIAQGMTEFGYDATAATLKVKIMNAINSAMDIHSPSGVMVPTGQNVAAGIAQGMSEYDFSAVTSSIADRISGGFSGLSGDGYNIGRNFGAGLQRGLRSKMASSLALAQSYAQKISSTFHKAWDIHSPSRVAEGLTEMFGAGLEKGMEDWPVVSERMLDADIGRVRRTAREYAGSNDTYNQQSTVNVNVDKLNARDAQDVKTIAYEIAALTRRTQRGRGQR